MYMLYGLFVFFMSKNVLTGGALGFGHYVPFDSIYKPLARHMSWSNLF